MTETANPAKRDRRPPTPLRVPPEVLEWYARKAEHLGKTPHAVMVEVLTEHAEQEAHSAAHPDLDIAWHALKRDFPTWQLDIGGTQSASGPGTVDWQARRGGVTLHSHSIPGLRRELAAQPAEPPEDGQGQQ